MTPRAKTDTIVIHCSATPPSMDIGAKEIKDWHREKGWETIGYHYVIRRNGSREYGRPVAMIGAHVQGHNATSIGICLIGGTDEHGKAEANFTHEQMMALKALLSELSAIYPNCRICGHRDLSPDLNGDGQITRDEWLKDCPSFDVAEWLAGKVA